MIPRILSCLLLSAVLLTFLTACTPTDKPEAESSREEATDTYGLPESLRFAQSESLLLLKESEIPRDLSQESKTTITEAEARSYDAVRERLSRTFRIESLPEGDTDVILSHLSADHDAGKSTVDLLSLSPKTMVEAAARGLLADLLSLSYTDPSLAATQENLLLADRLYGMSGGSADAILSLTALCASRDALRTCQIPEETLLNAVSENVFTYDFLLTLLSSVPDGAVPHTFLASSTQAVDLLIGGGTCLLQHGASLSLSPSFFSEETNRVLKDLLIASGDSAFSLEKTGKAALIAGDCLFSPLTLSAALRVSEESSILLLPLPKGNADDPYHTPAGNFTRLFAVPRISAPERADETSAVLTVLHHAGDLHFSDAICRLAGINQREERAAFDTLVASAYWDYGRILPSAFENLFALYVADAVESHDTTAFLAGQSGLERDLRPLLETFNTSFLP